MFLRLLRYHRRPKCQEDVLPPAAQGSRYGQDKGDGQLYGAVFEGAGAEAPALRAADIKRPVLTIVRIASLTASVEESQELVDPAESSLNTVVREGPELAPLPHAPST